VKNSITILCSSLLFFLISSCSKDCEENVVTKTEYLYEGTILNGFSCGFVFFAATQMFNPGILPSQYQIQNIKVRIKFELTGKKEFCPGFIDETKEIKIITIENIP
jgi:hypothetical protein